MRYPDLWGFGQYGDSFKAPLPVKILFGGIVVALAIYNIPYRSYKEKQAAKAFYENGFAAIVVSSSPYAGGRSIEYHLGNGFKLYRFPSAEGSILIGDSIQKDKDNSRYNVYRKNTLSQYQYRATYDYNQLD